MSEKKRHLEKDFWIIGGSPEDVIPLDCPFCKLSMRDVKDVRSYEEYSVCHTCKLEVIEPNLIQYNKGWRPGNQEMLKVQEYESTRPSYLMK